MDINEKKPGFLGRRSVIEEEEKTQFKKGTEKFEGDSTEFAYNLWQKMPEGHDQSITKTLMEYGATPLEAEKAKGRSAGQVFRVLKEKKVLDTGKVEGENDLDRKIREQKVLNAYGFSKEEQSNIVTRKEINDMAIQIRKDSLDDFSPKTFQDAKREAESKLWGEEELDTTDFITNSLRVGINSVAKLLNDTTGIGDKKEIEFKLEYLNNQLEGHRFVDPSIGTALSEEIFRYGPAAALTWNTSAAALTLAQSKPILGYASMAAVDFLTGYTVGQGRSKEAQEQMSPVVEGAVNAAIPGSMAAYKTLGSMKRGAGSRLLGMPLDELNDFLIKKMGADEELTKTITARNAKLIADKTMSEEAKAKAIIESAGNPGAHVKQAAMGLSDEAAGNIRSQIRETVEATQNLVKDGDLNKALDDITDFDKKAKESYSLVYDTIKETNNQQVKIRMNTVSALLDEVNDDLVIYPNMKMQKLKRKLETIQDLNGEGIPLSNVLDIVHDINGLKTTGTLSSKKQQGDVMSDIKSYLNGILDENLVPELRESLSVVRGMYKDKFDLIDNNKLVSELSKYIDKDNPGHIKNSLKLMSNLNGEDLSSVLRILGPKKAANLESAMIKTLVDSNTHGTNKINSFVDTYKIYNDLENFPFKTETGKAISHTLQDLGQAFTTDKLLKGANPLNPNSVGNSGMTYNLIEKAQYSVMSKIWGVMTGNKDYAMIRRLSKIYSKGHTKLDLDVSDFKALDEAHDKAFKEIEKQKAEVLSQVDDLGKDQVDEYLSAMKKVEKRLHNKLNPNTNISKMNNEDIITSAKSMKDDIKIPEKDYDFYLKDLTNSLKEADSDLEREWLIEAFQNKIKGNKDGSFKIGKSIKTPDEISLSWYTGKHAAGVGAVTGMANAVREYDETGDSNKAIGAFLIGFVGGTGLSKLGMDHYNKSARGGTTATFFKKGTELQHGPDSVDSVFGKVNLKPTNMWKEGDTLGDILMAPELYKSKPELKNIKVKLNDGLNSSIEGDTMSIGKENLKDIVNTLRHTIHETQHGVQTLDNLQTGSSPETAMTHLSADELEMLGNKFGVDYFKDDIKPSTWNKMKMYAYRNMIGEKQARKTEFSLGKKEISENIDKGYTKDISEKMMNMYWDVEKSIEKISDTKPIKKSNLLGMMRNDGVMETSINFIDNFIVEEFTSGDTVYKDQIIETISRLSKDKVNIKSFSNHINRELPKEGYGMDVYVIPKASDSNNHGKILEGNKYGAFQNTHSGIDKDYLHVRKTEDDNSVYLQEIQSDISKTEFGRRFMPHKNTHIKMALMDQISDAFSKDKSVQIPIKGWGGTPFRSNDIDSFMYDGKVRKEVTKLSKKMRFNIESKVVKGEESGFTSQRTFKDFEDGDIFEMDVDYELDKIYDDVKKLSDREFESEIFFHSDDRYTGFNGKVSYMLSNMDEMLIMSNSDIMKMVQYFKGETGRRQLDRLLSSDVRFDDDGGILHFPEQKFKNALRLPEAHLEDAFDSWMIDSVEEISRSSVDKELLVITPKNKGDWK